MNEPRDTSEMPPQPSPGSGVVRPGFLIDMALDLRRRAHTGVLELRDRQRWKQIVWFEGRPIWADGGDHEDRLGTMLLEQGTLDRPRFEAAVAAMSEQGIDFGSALTKLGFLSPPALYRQLRRLVLRRVVSAFAWVDGAWTLTDAVPRQTPSFPTPPLLAILEGCIANGDRERVRQGLRGYEDRWITPTDSFDRDWLELRPDPDIAALGPFLDGRRTLSQLRSFEVLEPARLDTLMWLLDRAGSVTFSEETRPREASALPRNQVTTPHPATDLAERIIRDYLAHWQQDYFRILGVTRTFDDDAVEEALDREVLDWSPADLPETMPEDIAQKAKALHAWVESAYETLGDPELRASYRARMDEGLTGLYRRVEQPGVAEAAMLFQVGKGFMRSRNYAEAERSFEQALERNPDEGDYGAFLGYARYKRQGGGRESARDAKEAIEEALERDPSSSMGWFFLGVVHRDRKDYRRAVEAFESCLRHDPSSEAARRALEQVRGLVAGTRSPLDR